MVLTTAAPAAGERTAERAVGGRPLVSAVLAVLAVAVVGLCVLDAARIATPLRSNVRFHDGVLHVFAVARGDLFDRAGVRPGDRVETVDGVALTQALSFADLYRTVRPGDEVRLRVRRDGEVLQLTAAASANLTPARLAVALLPVAVLLVLGIGVAAVRPRHPASFWLLAYCASSAVNNVSQLTMVAGSGPLERIMTAAYTLFSVQSPAILLTLFLVFPFRGAVQRRISWWLPAGFGIQTALGLAYWLPTVAPATAELLSEPAVHRAVFHAFGVNVMACYALAAVSLASAARSAPAARTRAQARLLFFGLALLTVLQLGLHELPLRLTDRTLLSAQAYALLDLLLPAFVAAAVLLHRLFDIDLLVRHGLVYGSASVLVAGVFVAAVAAFGWLAEAVFGRPGTVAAAASAATAALLFQPLHRRSQEWVDRVLYRRRYSFRRMLSGVAEQLSAVLDLDAVAMLLRGRIDEALAPEWVEVAVLRRPPGALDAVGGDGSHRRLCSGEEAEAVVAALGRSREPFRPGPMAPGPLVGAELVVPLARGDEVLGMVAVGRRRSDRPYLREDVEFLATLGRLAAAVLDNARLLEERAARERLAMVGSATSAIAHELKNPLAAIKSTAAILRRRLDGDPRGQELTRVVEEEIDRLQKSVLEVLTFVRPRTASRTPVAVDELVGQLASVVGDDLARAGVAVRLEVDDDLPPVWTDPERLRQAVLNLLLNARDAMQRGGEVRVRLARWRDGVEVEVADEGPGMTAEALERGFEPFFTTKRLGTGLGLANVRRFADEHGGEAAARNLSPRGAAVTLRLPVGSPPAGGGGDGTE